MTLTDAWQLLGVPRDVDPSDVLMESVHEAAGNVESLRGRVQDPTDDCSPELRSALVEKYADERDRVARMAKLAHDAGVEDRRVELAEAQAELVASCILAALSDPEWSLTPALQEAGRSVLGRHLRRLGAAAAAPAQG